MYPTVGRRSGGSGRAVLTFNAGLHQKRQGRTIAMLTDSRIDEALDAALAAGEVGIQVAAYSGDRLIVDAWAGSRAPDQDAPVDGETLFLVFSITKAVSAVALHIQA